MKVLLSLILCLFLFSQSYSQIITLERTECFGSCPVYKISLFKNGKVIFEGKKFVAKKGKHEYFVDTAIVNKLINDFLDAKYFSFKSEYYEKVTRTYKDKNGDTLSDIEMVTDLPTTVTTFRYNDKFHKVRDYYGAPISLSKLENKIDKLLKSNKYIN